MVKGLIKKIFGDKNVRATNEILPIVEQINAEYEKLANLTDDQLREKTLEFKNRIQEYVSETKSQIETLKTQLQDDDLEDKNPVYDELEAHEDELHEK